MLDAEDDSCQSDDAAAGAASASAMVVTRAMAMLSAESLTLRSVSWVVSARAGAAGVGVGTVGPRCAGVVDVGARGVKDVEWRGGDMSR